MLFASATLTWGAAQRINAAPAGKRTVFVKPTVVVPDVTGQAFVFAKGTLEDAGFAWRVSGKVHGYSTNTVATQVPAPGTKLIDTGAPLVQVGLSRGKYPQTGQPEDLSPYLGTAVTPASPPPAPVVATPIVRAAPAKTATPAKPETPAKPKTTAKPKKRPAPAVKRPPAFVVAGAPKEPLDEVPLTERAQRLNTWLGAHRHPSNANVSHFLYQQSWIVTGARFGWWHGADALRTLIAVDRRAQSLWGIGRKSEFAARNALAEVQARSR